MLRCRRTSLAALAVTAAVFGFGNSNQAQALTVFDGGPVPGLDIDLSVSVAAGVATFTFANNSTGGAAGSDVHEIYFESGLDAFLTGPGTPNATGTAGAFLNTPVAPGDPPAGNNLTPDWSSTFAGFDATGGAPRDPLSAGETWVVTFALDDASTTAAQLIAAINNAGGTSRIAAHIGDCVGGNSCGALLDGVPPGGGAGGPAVPIPGAAILFGSALAGIGGLLSARRRRTPANA